jgi:predicted transport protein
VGTIDQQIANQIANIEKSTGRAFNEWVEVIRESGLDKHTQMVAMLKQQHGLSHGNANILVLKAREQINGAAPTDSDRIDSVYNGRNAPLRALHDEVVRRVAQFGPDIEIDPKKSYVSLRRRKQFAMVGPAAGQLEIGLNLPGKPAGDRLRATSGMATHKLRISDSSSLDDELVGWLREAYELA